MKKIFKLVILGDPSVGKTSLRKRYMGTGFQKSYLPTMGSDFAVKNLSRGETDVELQIWDIAGQKGFDLLVPRFMKNSKSAFLVFDLTRLETLKTLTRWFGKYKESNEKNFQDQPYLIIGNKNDLSNQEVEESEIEQQINIISDEYDIPRSNIEYFYTSAKTGENIEKIFDFIVEKLIEMSNS